MSQTGTTPKNRQKDPGSARLAAIVAPGRPLVAAAALAGAGSALLWIPQAFLLAEAVGGLASPRPAGPGLWLFVLVAILALMRAGSGIAAARLALAGARKVKTALRQDLSAALSAWSPLDAGRPQSGEVAAILADHVEALEPYLTRYEPARFRVMTVPLLIAATTCAYSWAAAFILLVAGPLIPVFMALVGLKARKASERQLAEIGSINAYLADRLRGLADIRLLGVVPPVARELAGRAARLGAATMAVLRVAFLSSAVLELFSALGVALVAVYIGFHLLGYFGFGTYGGRLTLTGGLFILMIAPDFFAPLRDFAGAYHDRAAALAAADAFAPVLEGAHLRLAFDAAAPASPDGPAPAILLRNLSFSHPGSERPVIEDLSLAIGTGQHLAVTGPSGAGKTTLLGLIAGLAPPSAGMVAFLDADGRALDPAACRSAMTWISQRPHFLRTTVRHNLTLGREGISQLAIERALEIAAATDVVERLPHGLATMLGETGFGVSGGEAQRLAIARAALSGSSIILADEPTAHLDRETAQLVTDGLLRLAEGRTLIVATHDEGLTSRLGRRIALHGRTGLEAAQ